MRARYLGDHGSVTLWGITFPRGVYVDVTDADALAKIPNNSHFEVEETDAEEVQFTETPRRRGRKPKSETEQAE